MTKKLLFLFLCTRLCVSQDIPDKKQIMIQLSAMVAVDQSLRAKIKHSNLDESLIQEIRKNNKENIEKLKEILNIYYWITISEFGKEADKNAWLLVQHADHDVEFQKDILTRLEKLYPIHETSIENYAYLYDRVAKNENRLQKYGTQGTIAEGTWTAYAIEDHENLDSRRKAMGLSSFQEYINKINQAFNLQEHH